MISNETIYALSTARGRAGIAVVRISGASAFDVVSRLTGKSAAGDREARLRRVVDPATGAHLDTAVVLCFAGPASVTGEDVAELHIHGGRAVIEAVLGAISGTGLARAAEPGEFTRRGFDNGKLDLTEVEGLADLIDAETEAQRVQALRQYGGALGTLYEDWRRRLVNALAHMEAGIDFVDEADVPAEVAAAIAPEIDALEAEMAAHLDDGHRGERLRDGFHIAIVGAPNTGKSSVLNHLARRDAAIVSDIAGTTRDVVEVHLDLGGIPVVVADTAGLRSGGDIDAVEAEGMRRSRLRAEAADLRLVVIDGTAAAMSQGPGDEWAAGPTLFLVNKCDLPGWSAPSGLDAADTYSVSAKDGTGFSGVLETITQYIGSIGGESAAPPATRTRHREAVSEALSHLRGSRRAALPELGAEELRRAAQALGRITGRVDVEDLLDVIFRDFCIGK